MSIIGEGFLARHLQRIESIHADVLFLAAGVSHSGCGDESAFEREQRLVHDSIRDARARGLRLVYFSSSGVVPGRYAPNAAEDVPASPQCAYGRHKARMEATIRDLCERHLILRLSNLVGDGQQAWQLVPSLVEQITRGRVSIWCGAHRDLIDVEDVVTLTHRVLSAGIVTGVVNVASGVSTPVETLVDYLCERLGCTPERRHVTRVDMHHVPIEKLERIVGPLDAFGFNHAYYRSAIDRYYP